MDNPYNNFIVEWKVFHFFVLSVNPYNTVIGKYLTKLLLKTLALGAHYLIHEIIFMQQSILFYFGVTCSFSISTNCN